MIQEREMTEKLFGIMQVKTAMVMVAAEHCPFANSQFSDNGFQRQASKSHVHHFTAEFCLELIIYITFTFMTPDKRTQVRT